MNFSCEIYSARLHACVSLSLTCLCRKSHLDFCMPTIWYIKSRSMMTSRLADDGETGAIFHRQKKFFALFWTSNYFLKIIFPFVINLNQMVDVPW